MARTATYTDPTGVVITYRQGLPKVTSTEHTRPGTLVFADFGGTPLQHSATGPIVGSTSWEIRREAGAVTAVRSTPDRAAEYVVYRDGTFHMRCSLPANAYGVLKTHGCPSQWTNAGNLEASLSR